MGLRGEFTALDPLFEPFLCAAVGEAENGTELTVMSAMARLGLDPWGEALRLAGLPKAAAAESLRSQIASLIGSRVSLADTLALCRRVVELLPAHSGAGPVRAARPGDRKLATSAAWSLWLALGLAILYFFIR